MKKTNEQIFNNLKNTTPDGIRLYMFYVYGSNHTGCIIVKVSEKEQVMEVMEEISSKEDFCYWVGPEDTETKLINMIYETPSRITKTEY